MAIGGGVVLDTAGFAAGIYRRGVPYLRIPTTLLGTVDAGVGVKTGVNHEGLKNRLGAYHGGTTLVDPEVLVTLPPRHISNGLAEILKIALVRDRSLFDLMDEWAEDLCLTRMQSAVGREVMRRAIDGMLAELAPNLWETANLRRAADYGHSISPQIEALSTGMLHGEAVTADMFVFAVLSARRGYLEPAAVERLRR